MKICKFCGREIYRNDKQFCNQECFIRYKEQKFLWEWLIDNKHTKGRISKYIVRYMKSNFKTCDNCLCTFDKLQIHHINGNPLDNRYVNLQMLCPNCHVKTENYSKRKGK